MMFYKSDIEKIHVTLWITKFDCAPEEITKELGVEPTETFIKGEYRILGKGKRKGRMLNKENAWMLRSQLTQRVKPDKHLDYILSTIESHKERFMKVFNKYDSSLAFGIYWNDYNPEIIIDKRILKRLAELNLEIWFDTYYLKDDTKE